MELLHEIFLRLDFVDLHLIEPWLHLHCLTDLLLEDSGFQWDLRGPLYHPFCAFPR